MNTQDLLRLYNKLDLPAMQMGQLTTKSERLSTADAAMAAISKFSPVAGWLGFQSATRVFRSTEPRPVFRYTETTGVLLNAEVINTSGESLHLRYDSAGGWLITHFTYTAGGEYLTDTVKLAIHGSPGGFMYYRRFWNIDPQHGPLPFAACLTDICPT